MTWRPKVQTLDLDLESWSPKLEPEPVARTWSLDLHSRPELLIWTLDHRPGAQTWTQDLRSPDLAVGLGVRTRFLDLELGDQIWSLEVKPGAWNPDL